METQLLPGVIVRLATPSDVATFAEIHEEVVNWLWARGIHQWQPETFPVKWVEDAIARGEVYMACENSTVIGAVMLQETDPDTWGEASLADAAGYIHGLRVRRSVAGRSVGRVLIAWAERELAAHGKRLARLDCWAANDALCAYYERAGYRRVRTRTFADGPEPFVAALFEKALDVGCSQGSPGLERPG
jgi:ribosomal protein S18 acetylase RimI-like enzyme